MDKIKRLQKAMPDTMEAAIFRDPSNRFYLTGMRSSAGTVVVTKKHAWLIIDFRYFEDAEKKVKNCIVNRRNSAVRTDKRVAAGRWREDVERSFRADFAGRAYSTD